MKVLVVTLPQRLTPTNFPPIGALSVVNYLRKHAGNDVQVDLYNIDYHRPRYEVVLERIRAYQPDIIGISAVVSTAYAYTKRLAQDVKRMSPDTIVVVGGNLCASAEVLLHRASVDICVLGEGEKVFFNLVQHAKQERRIPTFKSITGLALLDDDKQLINTGYEAPLPPEEIWDVEFEDLEHDGSIDFFVPLVDPKELSWELPIPQDKALVLASQKKRIGNLAVSKGCVSRCTFCHRWDKGIRHIPLDTIFARLDLLISKYNVGVVRMNAEAFGCDKKWLDAFLDRLYAYNIIWMTGGVRTSLVSPALIQKMKSTGCVSIIYGNETGSARMLEVMEKKVQLQDNYNASEWTIKAGLENGVQIIIGMPAECPDTIQETVDYVNFSTTVSPTQDPRRVSVNFAQALPGTPLYEFARLNGLIGAGMQGEEDYLVAISDRNASDQLTFINFTNYSRLTVLGWQRLIIVEACHNYLQKFGTEHYYQLLINTNDATQDLSRLAIEAIRSKGKATLGLLIQLLVRMDLRSLLYCFPSLLHRFKKLIPILPLVTILRHYGAKSAMKICLDHVEHMLSLNKRPWQFKYQSLRKVVDRELEPIPTDTIAMRPLRKGR